MNKNIFLKNGYYAMVSGGKRGSMDQINWAFNVREEHGDKFTVAFANELLDFANTEYKKGCPDGYQENAYNPKINFTRVEYDMSCYTKNSCDVAVLVGKKELENMIKNKIYQNVS